MPPSEYFSADNYIEDPVVRTQVANTVNTISRYVELLSLYRQIMTSRPNCKILSHE